MKSYFIQWVPVWSPTEINQTESFSVIKLTHANRRMCSPAMLDDGNLHPVHFSIVSAAFHSFVLSVHVPKSFRQWSFHSSPPQNCSWHLSNRKKLLIFNRKTPFWCINISISTYLILFRAFSFSVIRRSSASSLASASFNLRSMSPILRKYVNKLKKKSKFINTTKYNEIVTNRTEKNRLLRFMVESIFSGRISYVILLLI